MNKKQKLKFISLGCAKALVDSEKLMGALKNTDFDITNEPEEAHTIVINTCGFIDMARQESVDTILQAAELKQNGKLEKLVVMGCLSERYPTELSQEIPEVDNFFGSNDHVKIIKYLTGKEFSKDDPIFLRSILTPDHYAYLKIAEGCDNGCSFCSIPIMRGLQKSRTIDSIMWEAEKLSDIKCSGNWMWSPKLEGEGIELYKSVKALSKLLIKLEFIYRKQNNYIIRQ